MSKRITVPATPEGLQQAADWLEAYKKQMLKKVESLVDRMVGQGEQWAINGVGHIATGETLSSIHGYRNGNKGVIVAGGNAIWIEFGTGVARNSGTDDVHTGEGAQAIIRPWGGYDKGHGASLNGWWYPDENGTLEIEGQMYSHTMGIAMTPFMQNTANTLKQEYPRMAKEIFK